MNPQKNKMLAVACAAALSAGSWAGAATNDVGGYLYGTNNWYATNTYVLTNFTYVMSNAVLNIEAGTVVKGVPGATLSDFGTLFITRGGKIFAEGTVQKPIIFTAQNDDVNNPFDGPSVGFQRGLWGGIIVLGNARLNNTQAGSTNAPIYDIYEGLPDVNVGGELIHRFGGTDDNDNSGVIKYVSIRHGGKKLESNKEVNGLSLGGIGRGTTVEYVEVFCIADDGFEFFGGAVNTKHLVSAFVDDDQFDADQGYSGTNQFWFGIHEPGARDEGLELNGQPTTSPQIPLLPGQEPVANWVVYNATLIGAGQVTQNGTNVTGNDAMNIRQLNECRIYNSIFTDFDGSDILISANSTSSQVRGNLFANTGSTGTGSGWAQEGGFNTVTNPGLAFIDRGQNAQLNPTLATGSPALTPNPTYVAPAVNGLQAAQYVGAFKDGNWALGWTALDGNAYFKYICPPAAVVLPVCPRPTLAIALNGANVDISWLSTAGCDYQLQTNATINGTWGDYGSPVAGDGGTKTASVPTNGSELYFRAVTQ